jgi:DNA-binding IclR family transcriptional regulator
MATQTGIPVLEKAIKVMETVADGSRPWTLSTLGRTLGIAPATAHRLLKTLVEANWLRCDVDKTYRLSTGLLPVLRSLQGYQQLIDLVESPMRELARRTGLTVKLSIAQGVDQVSVFRVESPRAMAASSRVNVPFSILLGASGGALLADTPREQVERIFAKSAPEIRDSEDAGQVYERLRQCQADGYCLNLGGGNLNIHTMAASLRNSQGEIVGTLTLLALPGQFTEETIPELSQALLKTVKECGQKIRRNQN